MTKLKKFLSIIFLSLMLVFSMPVAALAQEAGSAQEASDAAEAGGAQEAGSAPGAAPAPEADASPTPSPSPSPDITTSSSGSHNYDGYDWDNDDDDEDIDEDDLNLDGDEWVSSGRNSSGNVGDTGINTGDATANGTLINSANQTSVSLPCSVCVDNVTVKNSGNGAQSTNDVSVGVDSGSTVSIDNNANVNNNLNLNAVSGSNVASYNVGDSEITTGDANVSGVVITSANETGLGVVEYNIIEDHLGDIILAVPEGLFGCGTCGSATDINVQNAGNGADSTNSASVDVDNQNDTTINNDADIVNNLDLVADSGHNDTSYNTGGDSSIATGDANAAANLLNFVNTTISGGVAFVVNVFGDLIGDIIFPDNLPGIGGTALSTTNSGNGADSSNNIDIDSQNQNNTTLNNFADIDNIVTIDASTGENSTSYNTGGDSSIETGDVFVNAEVLNVVNTNLLGSSEEPLWLILVNNMGTWTGRIIGALTGTNYSGSDGLVFTVDETGEIVATNSGNGAGSTNDIAVSQNNTNNLAINNTANVTNNINITANTGGNRASYNTGGDSEITTGDANVAVSVMNFINTNLIGRTVMLGIINVFGSWIGDAVPPGEEPEIATEIVQMQLTGGIGGIDSGSTSGSSSSGGSQTLAIGGLNLNGTNGSFGSGASQGWSGFGGLGDDDGSSTATGGDSPSVLSDSVSSDGVFSLTFNWKILLASLIPLIAFGLVRAKSLASLRRQEAAVAHEIKVRKKK